MCANIVDAAMFVFALNAEGLSDSMLAAMALGLPCVCTDCRGGGAREMIVDGENGLLTPGGDTVALFNAMQRMLTEPGLAEKCSLNASKLRTELSTQRICSQWLELVQRL